MLEIKTEITASYITYKSPCFNSLDMLGHICVFTGKR